MASFKEMPLVDRLSILLGAIACGPLLLSYAFGAMVAEGLWLVVPTLFAARLAALWVTRPLSELADTAKRIREGNLKARPDMQFEGPWAEVQETLEALAIKLDSATRDLEAQVRERTAALDRKADHLRALGQVGAQVASVLEPAKLLPFVVRLVRGTFSYDVVAIVEAHQEHLVLSACAARGVSELPLGRVYTRSDPGARTLFQAADGDPSASSQTAPIVDGIKAKSQLTTAIRLGDRTLGAIVVQSLDERDFDEDDLFTLRTIAGQVAIALENARLFEAERRLRSLAITEERNRIAREIHDTLAQGFMGILMHLRAMRGATREEDVALHRDEAEALAEESLEEARRSVWNLRPERLESRGLAGALADELRRVQKRTGIETSLDVDEGAETLPSETAAVVLRIAQEALHNAAKHARASRVSVLLQAGRGALCMTVCDDGVGFDPDALKCDRPPGPAGGGFGIRGMRERARLLGGEITITSAPGGGTEVRLVIPTGRGIGGLIAGDDGETDQEAAGGKR